MSQLFYIHPDNPQQRLLKQAIDIIKQGGVVALPTDSSYALVCHMGDRAAIDRITRIRRLSEKHNFTLMCRDLSEIATYAMVSNENYRLLKALTPGPYTFILKATKEVPRRLQAPKRKTIGLRIPEHIVAQALLQELNEPLMSCTLSLPDEDLPMTESWVIEDSLAHALDLIIDGGSACRPEPTTVLDLIEDPPTVLRHGLGNVDWLS